MKLFTFEINDQRRIGVEWEGQLVDLSTAYNTSLSPTGPKAGKLRAIPAEMSSFIRLERLALDAATDALAFAKRRPAVPVGEELVYPLEAVKILAPLVRPAKVLVFESSSPVLEPSLTVPPKVSVKLPTTVIGPGAAIIKPRMAQRILSTPRLAVIIGKQLRRTTHADVPPSIFGYSIVNDISAGDHSLPNTIVGNFDTFCPFGPCIVTADEFADLEQLQVRITISGTIVAEAVLDHWRAPIANALSYLSHIMTLDPGDIVCLNIPISFDDAAPATGLEHDSDIGIEISAIGTLENPVIAEEGP